MRKHLVLAILVVLLSPLSLLRPDLPHAHLLRAYADAASRWSEIDGTRVHYKDEGAGPVIVLIHGTNASLHTWDGWASELRNDHRVIRLDLPGHGLSGSSPTGQYTVPAYVEFLDKFATELGINQFFLAGSSMGGSIAWHYALAHPDKAIRLILLAATGYPAPRPFFFSLIGFPVVGRLTTLMTPRFVSDMVLRELYGDDTKITPEIYARYAELSRHTGNRHAMHALLRAWRTDDSDRIKAIKQPTLILWGSADTFQPVAYAARFDVDIPTSHLIVYEGAGHVPMEELPGLTVRDVRAFLAQ